MTPLSSSSLSRALTFSVWPFTHGLQARDRLGPSGIKKTGRERKLYEDILFHFQASLPAYFLAGRCIGVTPTCSSAVYGAP